MAGYTLSGLLCSNGILSPHLRIRTSIGLVSRALILWPSNVSLAILSRFAALITVPAGNSLANTGNVIAAMQRPTIAKNANFLWIFCVMSLSPQGRYSQTSELVGDTGQQPVVVMQGTEHARGIRREPGLRVSVVAATGEVGFKLATPVSLVFIRDGGNEHAAAFGQIGQADER